MNFEEVHATIPYETKGKLHSNTLLVYTDVRVKYPGRHALDTDPVGGDFVIEALCDVAKWNWRQFTHTDIFQDVQAKTDYDKVFMQEAFAPHYACVISGAEPDWTYDQKLTDSLPGLRISTLMRASQCLAVAEHRRYHKYEAGGGGRYLPLRFAVGIMFGYWHADDASRVQRRGIHGYRELTKEFGNPPTVKALLTPSEVV